MGASTFTLVFRGSMACRRCTRCSACCRGLDVAILAVSSHFCFGFFLDALKSCCWWSYRASAAARAGRAPHLVDGADGADLQTSFLMPPSGSRCFPAVPSRRATSHARHLSRRLPFVVIQLVAIVLLWRFPDLAMRCRDAGVIACNPHRTRASRARRGQAAVIAQSNDGPDRSAAGRDIAVSAISAMGSAS